MSVLSVKIGKPCEPVRKRSAWTVLILTIMTIQLNNIGAENTVEIKKPLLSKYCSLANDLQKQQHNNIIILGRKVDVNRFHTLLVGSQPATISTMQSIRVTCGLAETSG